MSSLRNDGTGSFSTATHPSFQNAENERRLRAVSLEDIQAFFMRETKSRTYQSDLPSLNAERQEKKDEHCQLEGGIHKKRHPSAKSEGSSKQGCMPLLKCKKYKTLDEEGAKSSKMTTRQVILLIVLCLATLSSSFAICLFPPFFPQIVSIPISIRLH